MAKECIPIDLRKGIGPSGTPDFMKYIPVLDQEGYGICYAMAAAQMLDFFRLSNGDAVTSNMISPIALAVESKKTVENDPKYLAPEPYVKHEIVFGWIPSVFTAINNGSTPCKKNKFDDLLALTEDISAASFLFANEMFYERYQLSSVNSRQQLVRNYEQFLCKNQFSPIMQLPEIRKLIPYIENIVNASSKLAFLSGIINHVCEGNRYDNLRHIDFEHLERFHNTQDDKDLLAEKIHQWLALKNKTQPIGIRYCADFLRYENTSINILAGSKNEADADLKCEDMHVSLIIGQRTSKDGKSCEFLVRNSWGSKSYYLASYFQESNVFEDGNIWIKEEELLPRINSITVIRAP